MGGYFWVTTTDPASIDLTIKASFIVLEWSVAAWAVRTCRKTNHAYWKDAHAPFAGPNDNSSHSSLGVLKLVGKGLVVREGALCGAVPSLQELEQVWGGFIQAENHRVSQASGKSYSVQGSNSLLLPCSATSQPSFPIDSQLTRPPGCYDAVFHSLARFWKERSKCCDGDVSGHRITPCRTRSLAG